MLPLRARPLRCAHVWSIATTVGALVGEVNSDGDDRIATMGRLFLIAVVVTSPWWVTVVVRRLLARRAAHPRTVNGDDGAVPLAADDLGRVLAAIESLDPSGETVVLPARPTLSGRPVEPTIVTQVVADALRRSRVEVIEEVTLADGSHRLRCVVRR